MKSLLEKLHIETFVLDLAAPLDSAPQIEGLVLRLRDPRTLEVEVPKTRALNDLFAALAAQGISVLSMRNKSNRLEELFLRLVERNLDTEATA